MTTPNAESQAPLTAVAQAAGDPDLFPRDVVALHAQGKAIRARRALLKQSRGERDQARAAKQYDIASDLRVWLEPIGHAPEMISYYGIGTRLFGSHQPAADGSYIATLWLTILFVPIFPIAAYLVAPATTGGWYFLARAPLPPMADFARRAFAWAVAVAIAAIAWTAYQAGRHTDILVFNGFDRTVTAAVGERQVTIPPRRHGVVPKVRLVPTAITARWADDAEPFERLDADLAGHGRHPVVYNVAGRALLEVSYVVYGPGTPRTGRLLDAGPILFLDEKIDYLFEVPPDSKRVSVAASVSNSVLTVVDESAGPSALVLLLVQQGRREQALTLARAELMVRPENAELAGVAAHAILRGDHDAQVVLVKWCLERAPDVVDLHRLYQDLWPEDDREHLRETYQALVATNPRSAMHHYLLGRLAPTPGDEALPHYREALRLDPDYAPVYRALAYHAVQREAWTEALAHYDRFASSGEAEAVEVLEERVRLRRRLGRPVGEILGLLQETATLRPAAVWPHRLSAHVTVERSPRALGPEADALLRRVAEQFQLDSTAPALRNLHADLAVTAGDLETARRSLRAISSPEDRDAEVALRLALSGDAAPDDRALLLEIPNWWETMGPSHRLIGLAVLSPDERASAAAAMPPQLAELALWVVASSELARTPEGRRPLARSPLAAQVGAAFAAAALLKDDAGATATTARRVLLERARSLALPGELPHAGR